MHRVVLDTNILVSALWSQEGNPAKIVELFIKDKIIICYDYRILQKYKEILSLEKFAFKKAKVGSLINKIRNDGIAVIAASSDISFDDEDDKMFYEVAKECGAVLVTGYLKHFPREPFIMTSAEFLKMD